MANAYYPVIKFAQGGTVLQQIGGTSSHYVLRDGYAPLSGDGEADVTESARVLFVDTSAENVTAEVHAVEQAFEMAKAAQENPGHERCWVKVTPIGGGFGAEHEMDAELKSGKIVLAEGALNREQLLSGRVEAQLTWTRSGYWLGSASTVETFDLYNHDDAHTGHTNYCDIGNVTSELLTPLVLRITNTYNDGNVMKHVYLGHKRLLPMDTTPPAVWLEGEASADCTVVNGSSGTVCSGTTTYGQYGQLPALSSAGGTVGKWTIDPSDFHGSYVRVMGRFATAPPSGTRIAWKLGRTETDICWEQQAPMPISTSQMQELGSIQLPPMGNIWTNASALYLILWASGAGTLNLDYLQLTPTDSWRVFAARGDGAAYNEKVVMDDMNYDMPYVEDVGTLKFPGYAVRGDPVMLLPGSAVNRLYFLCTDNGAVNAHNPERTFTVQTYWRERRRTL